MDQELVDPGFSCLLYDVLGSKTLLCQTVIPGTRLESVAVAPDHLLTQINVDCVTLTCYVYISYTCTRIV